MKKYIIAAVIALIILGLAVGFILSPPVFCSLDIPASYREAIQADARGIYSSQLPLIPVFVTIDSYSDGFVTYTKFYFPFGTVGMEYKEGDGYSIEKRLTGW